MVLRRKIQWQDVRTVVVTIGKKKGRLTPLATIKALMSGRPVLKRKSMTETRDTRRVCLKRTPFRGSFLCSKYHLTSAAGCAILNRAADGRQGPIFRSQYPYANLLRLLSDILFARFFTEIRPHMAYIISNRSRTALEHRNSRSALPYEIFLSLLAIGPRPHIFPKLTPVADRSTCVDINLILYKIYVIIKKKTFFKGRKNELKTYPYD